jgi:3-phosphoshikimate 1-carboxyvinyltransferase
VTVQARPGVVRRARRLSGRLSVPSDKSISHRALIVNALSGGPAVVETVSPGHDVLSTGACLRSLGVDVDQEGEGGIVRFAVSGTPSADAELDCGNSGTTMRLLAGALAGLPLHVVLDGDASLRSRPMDRVASVLRAAGAGVATTDGHAPMTIVGRADLSAVTHRLPVASAQLLGTAVLAGLAADGETRIELPAEVRDHTERMLAAAGVPIHRDGLVTKLDGPARPRPLSMRVPGDPSSAAPWMVAAAIHPEGDVTIKDMCLNPTRTALVSLLERMGAVVESRVTDAGGPEPIGEVRVQGGGRLEPVLLAGNDVAALIDELPLVAVLMAAADGTSELRDASELRVKESDRIAATVEGLERIGAFVEELPDGWRVSRGSARETTITTRGDHRIAIAFAIAALAGVASTVELDDPGCVAISYPTFWADFARVSA